MKHVIDHLAQSNLLDRGLVLLGAGGGGIGPAVARALAGAGAQVLECMAINTSVRSINRIGK